MTQRLSKEGSLGAVAGIVALVHGLVLGWFCLSFSPAQLLVKIGGVRAPVHIATGKLHASCGGKGERAVTRQQQKSSVSGKVARKKKKAPSLRSSFPLRQGSGGQVAAPLTKHSTPAGKTRERQKQEKKSEKAVPSQEKKAQKQLQKAQEAIVETVSPLEAELPIEKKLATTEEITVPIALPESSLIREDLSSEARNFESNASGVEQRMEESSLSKTIRTSILAVWRPPRGVRVQKSCAVRVMIGKGKAEGVVEILQSSGSAAFDMAARRAVMSARYAAALWNKRIVVHFS